MPRTKEPDRDRYPNGRAKSAGGPTAETARKFQDRAAALHIPAGKEAGYAESTIGVLEARGMISVEQAELCKRLANLCSVLYGSGNAKCSSAENVGRGLPSDSETKSMRDTWTAYKAATTDIEPADRRLFEHVVLRNNYREWMKLADRELFRIGRSTDQDPEAMWATERARATENGSYVPVPTNCYRTNEGSAHVYGFRRELRQLLRVVQTLSRLMPQELRAGQSATSYTSMSQAQRDALDGGGALLDKLYAEKPALPRRG